MDNYVETITKLEEKIRQLEAQLTLIASSRDCFKANVERLSDDLAHAQGKIAELNGRVAVQQHDLERAKLQRLVLTNAEKARRKYWVQAWCAVKVSCCATQRTEWADEMLAAYDERFAKPK